MFTVVRVAWWYGFNALVDSIFVQNPYKFVVATNHQEPQEVPYLVVCLSVTLVTRTPPFLTEGVHIWHNGRFWCIHCKEGFSLPIWPKRLRTRSTTLNTCLIDRNTNSSFFFLTVGVYIWGNDNDCLWFVNYNNNFRSPIRPSFYNESVYIGHTDNNSFRSPIWPSFSTESVYIGHTDCLFAYDMFMLDHKYDLGIKGQCQYRSTFKLNMSCSKLIFYVWWKTFVASTMCFYDVKMTTKL